jgi:hypothetical protein
MKPLQFTPGEIACCACAGLGLALFVWLGLVVAFAL